MNINDLPIWRSVSLSICGRKIHNFDLVKVRPLDLVGSREEDYGSDEMAEKALSFGLEFAPTAVIKRILRDNEGQTTADEEKEGFFVLNKYGETVMLYHCSKKGEWVHDEPSTWGFGPKAPLIFVKPRAKVERQ